MTDYEFIKEFREIKMNNICKKAGVIQQNIVSGKTSEENLKRVKNEIINRLYELFKSDAINSEKMITFYLYNEILEKIEKENKVLREMI